MKKVFCLAIILFSFSFLHSMKKKSFDRLLERRRPLSVPPLNGGSLDSFDINGRIRRNNSDLRPSFFGIDFEYFEGEDESSKFNLLIHDAALHGDIEAIKTNKQDIFASNNLQQNVIHLTLLSRDFGESYKLNVIREIIAIIKEGRGVKDFINTRCKMKKSEWATALNIALSKGYSHISNFLIDHGADVTIPNSYQTSLYMVLSTSLIKNKEIRMKMVSKIIDVVSGPNYTEQEKLKFLNTTGENLSGYKETPLAVAIKRGFVDIAIKLIEEGADFIKSFSYDYERSTILHAILSSLQMSDYGKKRLFAAVLEQLKKEKFAKKKYNFLNSFGTFRPGKRDFPLNIAIQKGFLDIAYMLIEAGADITLANSFGDTSFIAALGSANISCEEKEKLIERLYAELKKTRYKDDCTLCLNRFELYASENINCFNLPIHRAAFYGDIEGLERHARDILKTNGLGQNVLHLVLLSDEYGLQKRVDMVLVILYIMRDLDEDSVKEFVNKQYEDGYGIVQTPLCLAIIHKQFYLAKELITLGADVALYGKKNTLLHTVVSTDKICSYQERRELVEVILANIKKNMSEAERVSFLNKLGKNKGAIKSTALDFCLTNGYFDIADLLIDAGADISIEDNSGCTAVTKVFLDGNGKLLHYFIQLYASKNVDKLVEKEDKLIFARLQLIVAFLIEASEKKLDTRVVTEFIKIFLSENNALFYLAEEQGRNLLHWVIALKQPEIFKAIIVFGALDLLFAALSQKSSHPLDDNRTPIEMLVYTNVDDSARLTDVLCCTLNNMAGKSIFEYAKVVNNEHVINILLLIRESFLIMNGIDKSSY